MTCDFALARPPSASRAWVKRGRVFRHFTTAPSITPRSCLRWNSNPDIMGGKPTTQPHAYRDSSTETHIYIYEAKFYYATIFFQNKIGMMQRFLVKSSYIYIINNINITWLSFYLFLLENIYNELFVGLWYLRNRYRQKSFELRLSSQTGCQQISIIQSASEKGIDVFMTFQVYMRVWNYARMTFSFIANNQSAARTSIVKIRTRKKWMF